MICWIVTLKNKMQPSKFEDIIDFIKWFMNQLEGSHVGLYKMEGFCKKKDEARYLLRKKGRIILKPGHLFLGEENRKDFIMQIVSYLYEGQGGSIWLFPLWVLDQKITDGLIKVLVLGESNL